MPQSCCNANQCRSRLQVLIRSSCVKLIYSCVRWTMFINHCATVQCALFKEQHIAVACSKQSTLTSRNTFNHYSQLIWFEAKRYVWADKRNTCGRSSHSMYTAVHRTLHLHLDVITSTQFLHTQKILQRWNLRCKGETCKQCTATCQIQRTSVQFGNCWRWVRDGEINALRALQHICASLHPQSAAVPLALR